MRVLFVIPNVISFQSFLGGLAAQMIAAGDEVHLACNLDALWGNDPAVPDQAGVRQYRIEFPRGMNPLQHFKAARQLRRLVATLRPDLIHAHFSAAIFTTALAHKRGWAQRATLGFTPEHCVFVFVGRFVSFKGFDATVRAFLRPAAARAVAQGVVFALIFYGGLRWLVFRDADTLRLAHRITGQRTKLLSRLLPATPLSNA